MNYSDRYLRQIASYSTVDVMLTDVAIRIPAQPEEPADAGISPTAPASAN
jgi:hypothetical protein